MSTRNPAHSSGSALLLPPAPMGAHEPEFAALVRLLSRLLEQCSRGVCVEQLKAALRSARREQQQPADDPWAWLTRSAARVGLRICRRRSTWAEARALLERGPLLTRGAQGWALLGDGPDRSAVYRPGADQETALSELELLAELRTDADAPIDCAVVVPVTPLQPDPEPAQTTSPLRRLGQFVALEGRDIRTLVVFSCVVGILNLATPVAVEALVNTVAFVGLLQPIVVLALVLATCLGLAAVIRILEAYVVELLQRRVFVRVATELAFRLPRVRRDAFDSSHGPELVNRFFDITTVQKVGSKLLLDGVTAVLSAGIGLLVLAFYHPLLLAFDVVLLAALAVIVFVMGRGAVRTAIKESSAKYAVADWLEELTRHPLAFHLAGGREIALDHADTLASAYLDRRRDHYRIVLRQLVGALALQVVTSTLLLGLGGWLVKIGELTLGQLVASWLIVSLVLASVAKLGRQLEGVYDLLAAADKLGLLLDLPLEGDAGEEPPSSRAPARVELRGVAHRWSGAANPTFFGVDLQISPGQSVAVRGASGAGKTTLLDMIQGQRPCASGSITFDGVDLTSLRLAALRPHIGLARPGEVFRGTVAENVRMGRNLDLDELRAALQAVGLWEAVQELPRGLDTPLTSYGGPLSQGQANLLALARVIASRPRLLLVDGLLDGLAEEEVEQVFGALVRGPWTLLVATRRDDVARRCQRTLALTRSGLQEVSR